MAGVSLDSITSADRDERPQLKQLYERYWNDLCRHIRATFGGARAPDPQDVAQSAFARYLSIDDQQAVENPRAFLYTTARNIALDIARHRKHADRHSQSAARDEGAQTDDFSPERIALAQERAAALSKAIENLPKRQRQALLLNRLHDLSYSEIAERIGSSKSDVRRQIVRALETIEAAMEAYE
ncbi:hypothetical protein GCM10011488_36650 [Steroidobacter agaridevorans]|nr:hypothetical protein GCM10011488_36650 [Steroidobacter agaridevorans]